MAALDKDVLGVVREGQRDHIMTLELGTAEQLQFLPGLQIIDHQQRPVTILCEGDQVPGGVKS